MMKQNFVMRASSKEDHCKQIVKGILYQGDTSVYHCNSEPSRRISQVPLFWWRRLNNRHHNFQKLL